MLRMRNMEYEIEKFYYTDEANFVKLIYIFQQNNVSYFLVMEELEMEERLFIVKKLYKTERDVPIFGGITELTQKRDGLFKEVQELSNKIASLKKEFKEISKLFNPKFQLNEECWRVDYVGQIEKKKIKSITFVLDTEKGFITYKHDIGDYDYFTPMTKEEAEIESIKIIELRKKEQKVREQKEIEQAQKVLRQYAIED